MLKNDLRKKYKDLRRNLSNSEIYEFSSKIAEKFVENFPVSDGLRVHIFLSSKELREVDTEDLIQYLFEKNCKVFVPKVLGTDMVSIEIFPDSQFQKGSFGISEPENHSIDEENYFDYVIVPLLYADNQGNRVGFGKGFYDKFFYKINQNARKIGVNFFPPNEIVEDASSLDVKLDYLVLPEEVLSFGNLASKFTK